MANYPTVALPQIVQAMQRDPRVLLANQALQAGSSSAPVVGPYDGLARVLQGAMGGIASKKAEQKYAGQQADTMKEIRDQLASVLSPANPAGVPAPVPGNPARVQGLPGNETHVPVPGQPPMGAPPMGAPPMPPQGLPVHQGGAPAPDPLAPLPDAPPAPQGGPPLGAPPMPPTGGPPMPPQAAPPPAAVMAPGMPTAPGIANAPDSVRRKLGMALMGGTNPYSFNMGLDYLDAGMQEDAQNQRETLAARRDLDKTGYGEALRDYYGSHSDARANEYQSQGDVRRFGLNEQAARNDFDRQWKLQQDQHLFTANENDKERYWGIYKWIGDSTGKRPEIQDIEGVNNDTIFDALVQQESSGNGMAKSDQGALGSTQMLPGTAQEMANKLGIPYQPAMLQSNTPEAIAYQHKLGRAYFDEGLEKYGGDVAKALMYYHGGPDEKQWGPKTKAYVGQVLSQLPKVMQGIPSGNLPALIHASNANTPGVHGGLFGVTPVDSGKAVNPTYTKQLEAGAESMSSLLDLSNTFKAEHFGKIADTAGRIDNWMGEHVGHGVGSNADTVNWWKQYDSMNNIVRNQLFGAALTQQEKALWDRSVINTGTDPKVAAKNLDQQVKILRRAMERRAKSAAVSYNSAQVYEQAGGDEMAGRINDYQPVYAREYGGEGGGGKPSEAPQIITLGNQQFTKDGTGWRLVGGTQAPKKATPKKPNPMAAGFVFGRQPGQLDFSKGPPTLLRRQ